VDVGIVAAVTSAALFALTTNLQREAASAVPVEAGGPLRLFRRLLVDRRWLFAGGVGVVALGLHAVALSREGVLVVQSVMTLGLVLALALEARRERRRLLRRELAGVVLIGLGVVAVVTVSQPAPDSATVRTGLVVAACSAVVLIALVLLIRSRRSVGGTAQARALAAGAGACFAVDAVFLQRAAAAGHAAAGHAAAAPGPGWSLTALVPVALGIGGFLAASAVGGLAVQRAYQVAPLRCVQPAVAAAEPVTAFTVGVAVLHEGVCWGLPGFVLLVAGITSIVAGIVAGVVRTTPSTAVGEQSVPVPAPADVSHRRSPGRPAVVATRELAATTV
jgi:hypothetical protein